MTQSFDAGRWWLLVGKHWSENRKKYSLSLLAIAGLLLLWFIVVIIDSYRNIVPEMQVSCYYTGLFLGGCFYGSTLFADLGSKTRGLNYLVVPASQLEKLLCALFYGVVVFFALYTAIFYTVDFIMIKISNAIAYSHWLKRHSPGSVFSPEAITNIFHVEERYVREPNILFYILLFYFVLQSAFICGSVYFARFSFIKTILSLLVTGLLITLLVVKVIFLILPPGSYYHGINSYQVYTVKEAPSVNGIMIYSDASTDNLITLPAWISTLLLFVFKFAFAPLFWLATYFRLKEKEM